MIDIPDSHVVKIVYAASTVGLLLLITPYTPPVLAIIGFAAVLFLGIGVWGLVQYTATLTLATADKILPEIPEERKQEYPDIPVSDALINKYKDDDITEEEFETRAETELEAETNT